MATYEATVVVSAHATVRFTTESDDPGEVAEEIALAAVTWDLDELPENARVPGGFMEIDMVDVNEFAGELDA